MKPPVLVKAALCVRDLVKRLSGGAGVFFNPEVLPESALRDSELILPLREDDIYCPRGRRPRR